MAPDAGGGIPDWDRGLSASGSAISISDSHSQSSTEDLTCCSDRPLMQIIVVFSLGCCALGLRSPLCLVHVLNGRAGRKRVDA